MALCVWKMQWFSAVFRVSGRALAVALLFSASLSVAQEELDRVTPSLRSRLATVTDSQEVRFSVVIRDEAAQRRRLSKAQRQKRARDRTESVLSRVPQWRDRGRLFENVAGFSGVGNRSTIESLAAHPSVERVYLDLTLYPLMAEGVPLTGADQAAVLGVTGSGVNVAVVDSGVLSSHVDLTGDIVSERCFCENASGVGCCPDGNSFMAGPGAAADDEGHGTNVTGIITSTGTLTSPGVAPGAGIVAIKVYGADSSSLSISSIDTALDWLLSDHASLGVRVINISLGTTTTYSNESAFPCIGTITSSLVSDLAAVGVATFIASGNGAVNDGLSFPACIPEAVSVGGVYDEDVGAMGWGDCTDSSTGPDTWVCHTNSSPNLDLVAPDWRTRTTGLGAGGANNFGGTSAAAPYAAGLAALLFAQDPSRTPTEVEALLISGAPLVTNPATGLSFPRADVSDQFPVCGDGEVSGPEECDDGNAVAGDCCSASCTFEPVASPCEDGDLCTQGEVCDGSGLCGPGSVLDCDDGLFCNGSETCNSLVGCQAGTGPDLGDGIACTQDACDEALDVVTHTPDSSVCGNGLYCDGAEICDAVLGCQAGVPVALDDGVSCTQDACDEALDAVTHTPDSSICSNGLVCDGAEVCDPLLGCQSGEELAFDDGVACTIDTCDEGAGGALHTPEDASCDDGDPCTADLCDVALGCAHELIPSCAVSVPASGPGPRGLLVWALIAAALLWGGGSRAFRARREVIGR